jgi:hypothetical protein
MRRHFTATSCISALGIACLGLASHVAGQTKVYFTEYQFNNPKIKVINLDGSNVQEACTIDTSLWLPIGLDFDAANNHIYWTNSVFNQGAVMRTPVGSATSTPLVTGQTFPMGLSLDLAGGKLYWGDNVANTVQRANLDGTNVETIFSGLQTWKPLVDPVNGYVYFAADGAIRRRALDGSGPVQTVVTGVSSVFALALDVANNHIYWVDQQLSADHVARANLDDTGWTVLVDISPNDITSSALNDIRLDLAHGKMYFCDDLRTIIWSANLDGSNVLPIYTSPPGGLAPSGLAFDVQPAQPMMDCNNNSIRDRDDVLSGTSDDCNGNGIPDECEDDPCAPLDLLLDQGSNTAANARTLGGQPPPGWQVYQPFDVPKGGWDIEALSIMGYTVNYTSAGFTATVFPDDGSGNLPNETQPLASADFIFRVGPVWVTRSLGLSPTAGRYWVRLTGNSTYQAGVTVGTSGLPSLSRQPDGDLLTNQPSIALRIINEAFCAGDVQGSGAVDVDDLVAVILGWGSCPGCPPAACPADVAPPGPGGGDCVVNVDDLVVVILNWGDCP